jgi:hypothetical protein
MDVGQRVVVVTGGAQGIGLATSFAFQRAGCWVLAFDTDAEALASLPEGVQRVQCDVGRPEEVEQRCAELERVDVLVNNAGIGGDWSGVLEIPVEEWDRVLNVNLRSAWLMAKYLVPKMPPGSAIVNIASTRALMSEPNSEPYSASKGGIIALTHSLAVSLAPRQIRVNCISPGWIDVSEFKKPSERREPELREVDHRQHPAGRVGVPDDIAEAVRFLASAKAGFITGANLVVDGGMTRKMMYQE